MKRSACALVRRGAPQAGLRVIASGGATEPQVVKAREIKLLRTDTLEDAAVCILSSTLDHFVANVPALRAAGAPESVHQMRVALRRMRAAIGLLRPMLTGPVLETTRDRAKNIASMLGGARDWDVFRDMIDAGPRAQLADEPGFFSLLDAVELRKRRGYREILALLDSPETPQFVSDLRRTVALRDWRATDEARLPGSACDFAATALTRLRKRTLKKSHNLARLSADARHEARIAMKKARYGAEFFQSLFDHRRRARAFLKALADMQDGLGVYNDMETANRLLDEIDADADPVTREASGFVRGWFPHAAQAGAEHAEESEKRLKALKPFWG